MKKLYITIGAVLIISWSLSFAEESKIGPVPAATGIGQVPDVSEVTRLGNSPMLADYIPLDKGNVWTYVIDKDGRGDVHTQRIVSESAGWSVFDNYFGKEGAALRIAPGGELLVSSGGAVSSFYTEDVTVEFPKSPVETPSGTYPDAMVVTMPEGGGFWFRDVYVRGVGLVYHEHKSRSGNASYELKSANVRGSDYPRNKPE